MISPQLLASRGVKVMIMIMMIMMMIMMMIIMIMIMVKVNKVVQEERDLIIVFPHAYHAGFNHGFYIAEASNFGTPR